MKSSRRESLWGATAIGALNLIPSNVLWGFVALFKIQKVALVLMVLAVLAGCSTTGPELTAESVEPVSSLKSGDSNQFADCDPAMASDAKLPMAAQWQDRTEETSVESLKRYVMLPKNADDLLALVKEAYKTDSMVAVKIAGVSQIVMCRKWKKAPAAREIWTCALLGAAEKSPDDYRKMFFLDQLRWCGKPAQADRVLQIGRRSGSKAVNDFSMVVATELMNTERKMK